MDLQEFYSNTSGISLIWLGNDGWVINMFGKIICTDLDLFLDIKIPLQAEINLEELAKHISAYFVTHAHGDHFNDDTAVYFWKNSECCFVIPESCCEKASNLGIKGKRVIVTSPGREFSVSGIEVKSIRAIHGHLMGSIYSGASLGDCGFVFRRNGVSIYQPGDTVLLQEHFEMDNIDIAFVSPTEHNMHIEKSLTYIDLLKPKCIIPQHYGTYKEDEDNLFWTHGYVDELYERLSVENKQKYILFDKAIPKRIV